MINKEIIEFKNYGKCIKISNGVIEAVATLDIGPRIISFGFIGEENIMNTKKDEFITVTNETFDKHYYKGAAWKNYGGHRLWASPEKSPNTYYPDCQPVEYTVTEKGVILTPPPQTANGLQMQIELIMNDNEPTMDVKHSMKNIGNAAQDLALWALTVSAQDGVLIVPMNTDNTGLLHNRMISVWPYTDMSDDRIFYGKKYITLRQDRTATSPVKLGFDLNQGTTYYVLGNSVFKKKYYPNHPNGRYPDGGVSMETYNCKLFIEIESLSEQKVMQPGSTETHLETWTMLKKPCDFNAKDNDSIDNFVNNLK